jgi:hypothetical protein
MSIDQHIEIALRKERLLARIDAQREELASYGAHLEKPFAVADKAIQAGRYVKQRPWITAVAVLAVVLLGRRNLWRWAGKGWAIWRGWRLAQQWLQRVGYLKAI